MSRKPSIVATLKKLAESGYAVSATLPDGTVINVLTGSSQPMPMPSLRDKIAARIDEIPTSKIRSGNQR